jgi:chromosome partitioning protein
VTFPLHFSPRSDDHYWNEINVAGACGRANADVRSKWGIAVAIIAVTNWKGGVGKTTTVFNLGAAMASLTRRVLLVDLDPQANLTTYAGFSDPDTLTNTLSDLMDARVGGKLPSPNTTQLTIRSLANGVDLLPGNLELVKTEQALLKNNGRQDTLRGILADVRDRYDFILIDCPPSIGALTDNALASADYAMIPVLADHLAMQRLARLVKSIGDARATHNPRLQVLGVLMTMVDLRTKHARDVIEVVQHLLRDQIRVFQSMIWLDVQLRDSSQANQSIIEHAPSSKAAQDYRSLASEIIAILPDFERNPEKGAILRPEEANEVEDGPSSTPASSTSTVLANGSSAAGEIHVEKALPRAACPYLGLLDDRTVHRNEPSREHRCYAVERPFALTTETQRQMCLDRQHQSCSQYLQARLTESRVVLRTSPTGSPWGRVKSWFRRA